MTVTDLANSALQILHHLQRAGVGANPSELARALVTFNRMVDSSNTSRANIFTERIDTWNTAVNQQTYSWGVGGTWNGPQPARITRANLLLPTSPTVRRALGIWDRAQWASIVLQGVYTYPEGLYCDYAEMALDGTTPAANVYLEPIPDAAYQIETYSWQANQPAATIATNLLFPPGYEEFWLYGLAERLAPMHGIPVPPDVKQLAIRTRQDVRRMNAVIPRLATDPALQPGRGTYNWMTGLSDR